MERALYFTKFRNLGFEHSERLVLNYSLEKGKMGNLVIIVGANNSGKSNVLDGLTTFAAKNITDRDITTLSYEEEYRKPQLGLVVKDEETEYTYRITKGEKDFFVYPGIHEEPKYNFHEDLESLATSLASFLQYCRNYSVSRASIQTRLSEIISLINSGNCDKNDIKDKVLDVMKDYFTNYPSSLSSTSAWTEYYRYGANENFAKDMYLKFGSTISMSTLNKKYEEQYGMKFMPQIVNYVETKIKNSDITCSVDNLTSNSFFNTVFAKIGIKIEEIKNTYIAFKTQNNKGALTTLEKKINQLLVNVADDFNSLYYVDDDKYKFEISLESNNIYFSLFRGTRDISLDFQSTGFKWFFNLYFNLLSKSSLNAGDIIVMDEPATNLHVQGRKELRKFLKEFAIKNDLTIVITTHDPFMIDLDYLDELRVVSMKDNISSICNDFTTVDVDDPDSLKPIKNALTVSNHVLLDPDKPVVFVEGITDYNYLIAFKKLLKIEDDIVFLPIQGVGNVKEAGIKEKQLAISKALIQLRKHNPILLVDGDNAGTQMKTNNKESALTVVSIKDIDQNFKFIESLFEQSDLEMLKIVKRNGMYIKHTSTSSVIKTFIEDYQFNENTINNFKKVFEHFINL